MDKMDNFSQQVVAEIEARGVAPKPRWHFLLRRSVFWTLAVLSILSGAIALSVADYIFFDNEGFSAASLLESPLEGIIQTVPFVWLIAFALFIASAYLSLRRTRTGYRHRTALAVGGAIVVTVLLSLVLNMVDFGQAVHYFLLNHTSFYNALIQSNDDTKLLF
jgi:glucan phosphoethanolaminetransferase (alkaline phosphatase superfamily)